ncbi:hypothetical protein D9M72_572120 [compost metagenome]
MTAPETPPMAAPTAAPRTSPVIAPPMIAPETAPMPAPFSVWVQLATDKATSTSAMAFFIVVLSDLYGSQPVASSVSEVIGGKTMSFST